MGKKLEKAVEHFEVCWMECWGIKRDVRCLKTGRKCDTYYLAACEAA